MTEPHKIAQDMADLQEMFAPVEEAARGYREHLERMGWSPALAEQIAAAAFFSPLLAHLNDPG